MDQLQEHGKTTDKQNKQIQKSLRDLMQDLVHDENLDPHNIDYEALKKKGVDEKTLEELHKLEDIYDKVDEGKPVDVDHLKHEMEEVIDEIEHEAHKKEDKQLPINKSIDRISSKSVIISDHASDKLNDYDQKAFQMDYSADGTESNQQSHDVSLPFKNSVVSSKTITTKAKEQSRRSILPSSDEEDLYNKDDDKGKEEPFKKPVSKTNIPKGSKRSFNPMSKRSIMESLGDDLYESDGAKSDDNKLDTKKSHDEGSEQENSIGIKTAVNDMYRFLYYSLFI